MPKEEHGTRKDGRIEIKGGRRKDFSSSSRFRCDVAEPDPLSSPSRMIRLDVCTATIDRERKGTTNRGREGEASFATGWAAACKSENGRR